VSGAGATRDAIRAFVIARVVELLEEQGRSVPATELHDDTDLLLSGLIDSLGLLELTESLNEHCGFEIDFEQMDPEQMTIVGPLSDFAAAQAANRAA
jgi:acyl carrier protein